VGEYIAGVDGLSKALDIVIGERDALQARILILQGLLSEAQEQVMVDADLIHRMTEQAVKNSNKIDELQHGNEMLGGELFDLEHEGIWKPGSDIPHEPGSFLVFADDQMREDYLYPDGHWLSCDGRVEWYRTMPKLPPYEVEE
jgi:hypothetical protein